MPPATFGKPLSPQDMALLTEWVKQGAPYAKHWAYAKPVRPPLPDVRDRSWPRNPIDDFILARLEREGLKPSPEADRYALIRRVSLDLTGLPPTADEVDGSSTTPLPTPTRSWSTGSSTSPRTASTGRGSGSTWPATPIRPAMPMTRRAPSGRYRDYVIAAFNQQAVRPVHHRANRRRPPAQPDRRAVDRHRLPSEHADQQRGRAPTTRSSATSPSSIASTPRWPSGWARRSPAASATTTSTTRSPEGILPALRVLQQHRRRRPRRRKPRSCHSTPREQSQQKTDRERELTEVEATLKASAPGADLRPGLLAEDHRGRTDAPGTSSRRRRSLQDALGRRATLKKQLAEAASRTRPSRSCASCPAGSRRKTRIQLRGNFLDLGAEVPKASPPRSRRCPTGCRRTGWRWRAGWSTTTTR